MVEITKKMAAEMVFISFCNNYRHCEGVNEVEHTILAILRGTMVRAVSQFVDREELSAYMGRWKLTILPVVEGLNE